MGAGELSDTNNLWTAIFTLPKLGESATYSVTEDDTFSNYKEVYPDNGTTTDGNGNTVINLVNKVTTKEISVTKVWKDAGGTGYVTRPASITLELQCRASGTEEEWKTFTEQNTDGRYILTSDAADKDQPNYWYGTISGLPVEYDYQIVEVPDTENNHYEVTKVGKTTIVNTLKWQIIKQSSSKGEDGKNLPLTGAVFKLTMSGNNAVYYGQSEDGGVVKWYGNDAYDKSTGTITGNSTAISLPTGTYTMEEIAAPAGYLMSTEKWTLTIDDGVPSSIIEDGENVTPDFDANGVMTFYYEDEVVYTLPSAGGEGIFLYLIAGMLLMMGGALLIFVKRRKVLRI
jgi:LPXTG-motif cell wall-anchored protein